MRKKSLLWILLIAILSMSCSPEKGDWKKAQSQYSIKAYEEYLAKYPEGKHAAEAKEKITKLYYEQAESANTIEAYEDFLIKHPEATYVVRARAKLRITKLCYEQAESVNTIEAYEEFLAKYPKGRHAAEAIKKITDQLYQQAESVNTIDAYEEFLKRYPNGPFAVDAKKAISKKKSGPFDATVLDDQGNSSLVEGLEAYYESNLTYLGTTRSPSYSHTTLYIVPYNLESAAEKVTIQVRFYEIRKIDFSGWIGRNIHIQKWDGSSILISRDRADYVLREEDSDGKTVREIKAERISYYYSPAPQYEHQYYWKGFSGRAKGESGREGKYYIGRGDIRSISFRER